MTPGVGPGVFHEKVIILFHFISDLVRIHINGSAPKGR